MQKCANCYEATTSLQMAADSLVVRGFDVGKLYSIAHTRVGLRVTAKHLADIAADIENALHVDGNIRKLIEQGKRVCENADLKWPK